MTLATKLILIAALVLSIFIPFGYYLLGEKNKGRYQCALAFTVLSYFGTFLVAGIMLFGSVPVLSLIHIFLFLHYMQKDSRCADCSVSAVSYIARDHLTHSAPL